MLLHLRGETFAIFKALHLKQKDMKKKLQSAIGTYALGK